MTEVEKKGIGKAKAGLVVSAVLIVILAVSNVWSYTSLQNQINTLNNEKSNLQGQINTLHSQLSSLNTTYQNYTSTHSYSNSEYDSLNTEYQNYVATHSYSNSEYDSLQSDYNNYVATHHHTDSEYDSLKSENDALKAPKLIKVNLKADDVRPWLGTPYLDVYGYICNVGYDPAYNSKVHVVAYQSGGVVAIDTYINLGTIFGAQALPGGSWTSVDANIYYSGSALTGWTLTLEWTTTP